MTHSTYVVELSDTLTSDLGEMTELQLLGYLSGRRLAEGTPEEVLAALERKDEVTVHFEPTFSSGKIAEVRIRRTRSAS